ncbi:MAG: hypothetical protein O7D32_07300, partial [bacterium]|nr:hypothetical protein [bacterium]
LALIAGVIVCIAASAVMMPYVPDDSYISFRYAEHLAEGQGLTFNPGEPPVEAYSNLRWIVICAGLHKMGLDLPSAMPVVGLLISVLSVIVLWMIFRRRGLGGLQMVLPLVLLGTSGPVAMYAISGMEMPLFALLLLVSHLLLDGCLTSGRTLHAALLAVAGVLIALCRPEGMVVFPVIAIATWFLTRGRPEHRAFQKNLVLASVFFAVVMVVYHIWRVGYFGELLPTPLLSKGGGGKSVFYAWGANIVTYFRRQGDFFPPLGYYFTALTLVAWIGLKISRDTLKTNTLESIAFITAAALMLIYFNFKDWMPGMRYHSAVVGVLLIPAAHVLTPAIRSMRAQEGAPNARTMRKRFWFTGAAVVLVSLSTLAELRIVTTRTEESNQKCLVALGKWLKDVLPTQSVLAMSDVGAVPYYSGFRTVDFHPESLTDLHIAKKGFSSDYVFGHEPDVMVIPSRGIHTAKFYPEHYTMAQEKRFKQTYGFIGTSRYDWQQDRCYWVFISRAHRPPTQAQMDAFPIGIGTLARKGIRGVDSGPNEGG